MTATQFYDLVFGKIFSASPELLWPSETDSPLVAVTLPWYKTIFWKPEPKPERYIRDTFGRPIPIEWRELLNLFLLEDDIRVYKIQSKEKSVYDLYVLRTFGTKKVGFKTQLVET